MSYSQRDEEKYILQACANVENKRFLDIGAFDPFQFSNTRALYELGWRGVMVEPSPKCVRELVKEYGNADGMHVICAAVGGDDCELISMEITDDAVSSHAPSDAWLARGGFLGTMFIHQITIKAILDQFGAFSFVSIDTEGTSVDLLKEILATEMFPTCICCEFDDRQAEAQIAAQERGYQVIYTSCENVVLAR